MYSSESTIPPDAGNKKPEAVVTPATDESWRPLALVVDDDDQSSEVMRQFLKGEGLAVVRSISGEDALREAARHTFALIVLDLQLYSMNGWQFLTQMHEAGLQPQVPVVIVSGRSIEDDLVRSRGVVAALQKPIHFADLNTILDSLGLLKATVPAPSR
jgi:CheY-like chemotaxis protein